MGHPPPAEPTLGEPLDFMRTIWAVDHALAGLSRAMESRLGLTGPQRLVVRVIGRVPGVSPSALARVLHLDPSTLSGHLNRLARLGIITRQRTDADARRYAIKLTAAGRRVDVSMPGTLESAVRDLDDAFEPRELALARRILEHLARSLRTQTDAVANARRGTASRAPKKRRARKR